MRRLLGKLGKEGELRVCYEAGPTGYALYWQLTSARRGAIGKRSYQAGKLTAVWVPDPKHERYVTL